MGLFDEINKATNTYGNIKGTINSPYGNGGQLFQQFMPQEKNVEQDVENNLPHVEGEDKKPDWSKVGNALSGLGGSFGGGGTAQKSTVGFTPQNMQINSAQMVQPIQNQGLANIGRNNLYNYLMG